MFCRSGKPGFVLSYEKARKSTKLAVAFASGRSYHKATVTTRYTCACPWQVVLRRVPFQKRASFTEITLDLGDGLRLYSKWVLPRVHYSDGKC